MYTVKRLAALAGVSVRTLHYYHQIELLVPTTIAANGYRHYDEAAVLRLQQVMFYREMGLELLEIKAILDDPDFDTLAALRAHRDHMQRQIQRFHALIDTVDQTINRMEGNTTMSDKHLFDAFDNEKQQDYQRRARLQYEPEVVREAQQRWGNYNGLQKSAIMDQMRGIYADIVRAIETDAAPQGPIAQEILVRWHDNLRHFYEPTFDILRGLGQLYNTDPEFIANFQHLHADLPAFLETAITHYVDALEHKALVEMLAEEEEADSRRASF